MDTELKTKIRNYLADVDKLYGFYNILMDNINYHISNGSDCSNVFPLAIIIEQKLKNLTEDSDKIFYEVYCD